MRERHIRIFIWRDFYLKFNLLFISQTQKFAKKKNLKKIVIYVFSKIQIMKDVCRKA